MDIEEILDLPEASEYTLADVERVVRRDKKGRFTIKSDGIAKRIKATQGHTIEVKFLIFFTPTYSTPNTKIQTKRFYLLDSGIPVFRCAMAFCFILWNL